MIKGITKIFKHDLSKQKIHFRVATIKAGEIHNLQPSALYLIRPYDRTLELYAEDGTRLIEYGMGFTMMFSSDLNEGGATGEKFRVFAIFEKDFSIMDITDVVKTYQAIISPGAYFKNNSNHTLYIYHITRG